MNFVVKDNRDLNDKLFIIAEKVALGLAKGPVVVTLGREKRTLDQNRKIWPMMRDLSRQLEINGQRWSERQWSRLLMGLYEEATWVPGLNGEMIPMTRGTSELNKVEFSELIELTYAYGSEQGIEWSEGAQEAYERYKGC